VSFVRHFGGSRQLDGSAIHTFGERARRERAQPQPRFPPRVVGFRSRTTERPAELS